MVGLFVGVKLGVGVGILVGVRVMVGVKVIVGVEVIVGVGKGAGEYGLLELPQANGIQAAETQSKKTRKRFMKTFLSKFKFHELYHLFHYFKRVELK